MAATRIHAGEVRTDVALIRRLLAGQFPVWADLPIEPVASYGTDHDIYRLGERLAARLPRIEWATNQAAMEAEWLPKLAPHLPLAVPVPLAKGHPAAGYPFQWSVYEWLPGENANGTIGDLDKAAIDLAAFITALRKVDRTGAPARLPHGRGGPLVEGDEQVRRSIAELGDRIDGDATTRSWEESLAAPAWEGEEVWVHGDLLPGNLLVVDGRLSAVIDFGGLNLGDPACDLQPAWNVFGGTNRARFRVELQVDDASWLRGRGWALFQAVSALPYYWDTNPGIVRQASHALSEVLAVDVGPSRLSCNARPLPSSLARDLSRRGARAMAMKRKASSTRKPPEPSESHAEIDDWMRRAMPDLNPIVTRLDKLIRETHSDLRFAVKWKKAYYGLPDVGWMMEMVAYDVSVNVVFFGGADFDPSPPLGDADRSRYIKLKTMDEVEHPELKSWIEQAGRVPGWKE